MEPAKPGYGTAMPVGTDGVRQIAFGGGADGVAAFMGSAGITADQHLTVANVKSGALIGRVTLPNDEPVSGIAVAPGGRFAAVHVSAPGSGDVVLYEVATKQSYRHTPYSRKGAIFNPDLVFVGFVDPDRLLTAHEASGFDVWQLPAMTRLCGLPGRGMDAAPRLERNHFSRRCKNAALSPDGKTFALFDAGGFSFHDTTTAERTAKTPPFIAGRSANFWAAAFSPDGKRFAATTSYFTPEQVTSLQLWDVASGKRVSAVPVEVLKTGTAMAFLAMGAFQLTSPTPATLASCTGAVWKRELALAIVVAWRAAAATPAVLRSLVAAKPQAPLAITRMPMPVDSAFTTFWTLSSRVMTNCCR